MPVMQIKSLPLPASVDMKSLVEKISIEFASSIDVNPKHVSVVWEVLQANTYAVGGVTAARQPSNSHPILVDLLVPNFYSNNKIEAMLHAANDAIASRSGQPKNNIFINCRTAQPGFVLDGGEIFVW